MKISKKQRQPLLKDKISENPFITDEALAEEFKVSVQTVRLDRLELNIPEVRERIKHVASGSTTQLRHFQSKRLSEK